MICANCSGEIAEGKKFCGRCGSAVQATTSPAGSATKRSCLKCGSPILAGKRFCGVCGTPLTAATDQEQDAALPSPVTTGGAGTAQVRPTEGAKPEKPKMASTAPVAPAALRTEDTASRVRSGQRMSGKMLGVAILPIVLLCAALGWYRWGVELRLTTEPSETQVVLDGTPVGRTMGPAGSLVLPHLGRGTHQLRLSHPGFDTWSQPVTLGWFQLSLPLNVKLPIPSFPLTVITVPGGARVLVDGKESGVSDQSGSLVLANVERGQHVATVTLNGYPSWSSTFFMQAPLMVRADLVAAAQVAERENAERLGRAQSLFEQRQYQAAVSECDEVLRVDPANQAAAKLKSQIQQTMAILGMQ